MNIRNASIADTAKIAPLFDAYRQFYEQEPNLEFAKQFISDRLSNNESIIFVAEDEAQNALGFCQIYPSFCSVIAAPIYTLSDLFVSPNARQSGLGKMLLEKAREHAQANNIPRMDLTTAKTNLTAQSLYESLGWVRDDIFYAYNKSV
ncbi:N-acetyltransferase [Cellvibrio zantedeschiae]|uniref:N-acetyltransferase n=1 Tax=Cellvibrio zantedeschiae TaxID=1237077 RepID=A0ABQ3AUG5_9GAMM|nr:N-acetyltransferase [Cellvibrio zantedeschiae]GGY67719.1 N-acetyltransferase [Cellvibrio zantedeschiae]